MLYGAHRQLLWSIISDRSGVTFGQSVNTIRILWFTPESWRLDSMCQDILSYYVAGVTLISQGRWQVQMRKAVLYIRVCGCVWENMDRERVCEIYHTQIWSVSHGWWGNGCPLFIWLDTLLGARHTRQVTSGNLLSMSSFRKLTTCYSNKFSQKLRSERSAITSYLFMMWSRMR